MTQLIGLHGPARSGKDTVGAMLIEDYNFEKLSFASYIRQFIADILGISLLELEHVKDEIDPTLGVSPRVMMQTLGTDWGRNMINQELWVIALETKLRKLLPTATGVVITDVRFENEAGMIRKLGGNMWHITRPTAAPVAAHISEAGIRPDDTDCELDNSGNINDLYLSVSNALVMSNNF